MATIPSMEKSRAGYKLQLSKYETKVEGHEKATKPLTPEQCDEILQKLQQMDEKVTFLNESIIQLCTTDAEMITATDNADDFETSLREMTIRVKAIKKSFGGGQSAGSSSSSPFIRLPKLDLPKFDGNFENWTSFQDLFLASVDNNKSLSGAQKLQLLKSYVTGEAYNLIKSFTVTDLHYSEAWSLLENRYDNNREIIFATISKMWHQSPATTESSAQLRKILDVTTECIRLLRVLTRPVDSWDDLLVFMVSEKLDAETRREWAMSLRGNDPPTFKDLQDFLELRIRGLQAGGMKSSNNSQTNQSYNKPRSNSNQGGGGGQQSSSTQNSTEENACFHCKQHHNIFNCSSFKALSTEDKCSQVKSKFLCLNCLRPGHMSKSCPSKSSCRQCSKRHHTLLHFEKKGTTSNATVGTCATTASPPSPPTQPTFTLLMTANVKLVDNAGHFHIARAFIDPGSEVTLISEECVRALKLKRIYTSTDIHGAANVKVGMSKSIVNLNLSSCVHEVCLEVEALVLPKVTSEMPKLPCDPTQWEHLQDLALADPSFYKPGKIDILLGADVYSSILRPGIKSGVKNSPLAQNTVLGWILSGKVSTSIKNPLVRVHHITPSLDNILEKFWKVEEVPSIRRFTPEEEACENHFQSTYYRDSSGRFVVQLPFNNNVHKLGTSRDQAMRRLMSLERRFTKFPSHAVEYRKFLAEYEALGHMEIVPKDMLMNPKAFYLPHHFVIKENSTTTKLRVVFDGSAKTSSGISLNEAMLVGPTIQDDIFTLLCRFRTHAIALKADITKMYRQFKVSEHDANYQRILWRPTPSLPVSEYRLLTVTYGTSSAPYLATKAINQLALEESSNFPIASKVLSNDLYVDDCMSGAPTVKDAIHLQQQLTQLVGRAGMEFRKWMSNSDQVLQAIPSEFRETAEIVDLDDNASVNALGVKWIPREDSFSYSFTPPVHKSKLTKREILSDLARVFDPLGFLSPVTLNAKLLFQELWKEKIGWDEPVGIEVYTRWKNYQNQMPSIQNLRISRFISQYNASSSQFELHGFCDGSLKAYSACVYLKSTSTSSGIVKVELVAAKAKVAPVKQVTIPRMELLGAVLLNDLILTIKKACNLTCEISLWTDSTIVLDWLNSYPSRWKTFVANRVSKIQEEFPVNVWNHVISEDNPADCASRGITPDELISHPLWWHGPSWLKESKYPQSYKPKSTTLEEKQIATVCHVSSSPLPLFMTKYSSLRTLTRVVAYARRFINNSKKNSVKSYDLLTTLELRSSLLQIIKIVQEESFPQEVSSLSNGKPIHIKSKLRQLCPFLDGSGVLRVGGRLQHADASEDKKHPILIPHNTHFAWLLVHDCHITNMHSGFQLTSSTLSREYWITHGRDTIRHIIRKCVPCRRYKAKVAQQLMGSLPTSRVTPTPPFMHTGVDYAGPYSILLKSGRGVKTFKCYFALFVCFSTKAIHLEYVTNLSSEGFLACFQRFVARRGRPSQMSSDCGTNFIGADNEMKTILESMKYNEEIASNLSNQGTTWKFNPPHAPHQGGLWESGVKSVKFHLRRVVGTTNLTLEEFGTLLCNVEGILNSRPLCAMSPEPDDLNVLTPGHFLIGRPINSIPELDITDIKVNRLSRWQHVQQMTQHFWKRWRSEYLSTLQQRFKWTQKRNNLKVGDLVLVHDDLLPPTQWKMARIIKTHPGEDSLVRVVTLKTSSGEIKRPIAKLSPILPNNEIDSD